MTKKAKATGKAKPRPDDEASWTVRLPQSLIDRLDARVEALNEQGLGKWSRNGLVVFLLTGDVGRLERSGRLSDDAPAAQAAINSTTGDKS